MLDISSDSESSSQHSSQELEDMNVDNRVYSREQSMEQTQIDPIKDNDTIQLSKISPRIAPAQSVLDEDPDDELDEKALRAKKEEDFWGKKRNVVLPFNNEPENVQILKPISRQVRFEAQMKRLYNLNQNDLDM